MITLITGTPGVGKTLWTVSELIRVYYFKRSIIEQLKNKRKKASDRKLYVHGIPDLDIGVSYTKIYCRSSLCDVCKSKQAELIVLPEPLFNAQGVQVNQEAIEQALEQQTVNYVEDWQDWAEVGSLIILDEVQRIWRPRASGSIVPSEISALETHRHRGLDFWLISQSSKLIDTNIRRLVGRHIHLVATWKGRTQYEWSECKDNVSSTSDAVSRPYFLNKTVFSKYRSASLHTKLDKRKPLQFYVFIISLILAIYMIYRIGISLSSGNLIEVQGTDSQAKVVEESIPSSMKTQIGSAVPVISTASSSNAFDFKPRTPGRDETAPAYDGKLHIESVPFPEQCMAWTTEKGEFCRCLTDQGTTYKMAYSICIEYAKGEVYNPYKPSEVAKPVEQFQPAHSSPVQIANSNS